MRDYQRKHNNKYILPNAVYNATIWQIRDYNRLKDQLNDLADTSAAIDYSRDKVQTSANTDATLNAALRYSHVHDICTAIETAKENMPEEYRIGVWNNILYYMPYPIDADRSTYGRVKSKFIYEVATSLEYI